MKNSSFLLESNLALQYRCTKFNESREAGEKQNYYGLSLNNLVFKEKRMIVISEGRELKQTVFINTSPMVPEHMPNPFYLRYGYSK